jgi:hypothetical protein
MIFYKLTTFQFCKLVSINMTAFLAHDAVYKGIMVSEIPDAFSFSFKNYTSHIWENQNFVSALQYPFCKVAKYSALRQTTNVP